MLQYSLSFSNRNAPVGSSPSDEHPLGLHLKDFEMLKLKLGIGNWSNAWHFRSRKLRFSSRAWHFDEKSTQVGDHRHLDGAALARFSNSFKSYMEDVSQFRHLCFVQKILGISFEFKYPLCIFRNTCFIYFFRCIFTLIYLYCWSPLVLDFPCLVKSCTRLQFPSSLFQVSLLHLQLEAVSLDTFRVL